jgi:hypothetical protein
VKITLASEDVIHSFFIPAFRIKHDVVPGHYDTMWFTANKPGRYHLFCAEYCGTEHSGMVGWVTVMNDADYENWLSRRRIGRLHGGARRKAFRATGLLHLPLPGPTGPLPVLRGVYGSRVQLDNGKTVLADDAYIREVDSESERERSSAGFKPTSCPPSADAGRATWSTSDTYNKFFTMHGIMMVFFFLIPSIPATSGQFPDAADDRRQGSGVPRINLLSWYIYMSAACFALVAAYGRRGYRLDVLHAVQHVLLERYVMAAGLGIFIAGFSSILTGLNFIVTIHRMRAPGMTWFRLPLFVWAHYATSMIQVLGTPVIAVTLFLLVLERGFHIGFFDPAYRRRSGPVPAHVLVLLASGRLHHDSAVDGRDQRNHHDFQFARSRSDTRSSRFRAWPSRCSDSSSGAITCSSAASRCMPAWCSRS